MQVRALHNNTTAFNPERNAEYTDRHISLKIFLSIGDLVELIGPLFEEINSNPRKKLYLLWSANLNYLNSTKL